jgi:galactose mutarotase-like enzyme
MIRLQSDELQVSIKMNGAELASMYSTTHDLEYMWNGDPRFWSKHSPVLFPVVGALKNGTYLYNGAPFNLQRHGFAREKEFRVEESSDQKAVFLLQDDELTRATYPFSFELRLIYQLTGSTLRIEYEVFNKSLQKMYFSIGAHPAFRVPLVSGTEYTDYYLKFEKAGKLDRWSVSEAGLIKREYETISENSDHIELTKPLFHHDALVFKDWPGESVSILTQKSQRGIKVTAKDFPYLGIWAAKDADFVCIEPWLGIADHEDADQNIAGKEGILSLPSGERFSAAWTIECF